MALRSARRAGEAEEERGTEQTRTLAATATAAAAVVGRGVETEAEEGWAARLRGRGVGEEQRVVRDRKGERGDAEQGSGRIRGARALGKDPGGRRRRRRSIDRVRGARSERRSARRAGEAEEEHGTKQVKKLEKGCGTEHERRGGTGDGRINDVASKENVSSFRRALLQVGGGRAEEGGRVLLRCVEGGGHAQGERVLLLPLVLL